MISILLIALAVSYVVFYYSPSNKRSRETGREATKAHLKSLCSCE